MNVFSLVEAVFFRGLRSTRIVNSLLEEESRVVARLFHKTATDHPTVDGRALHQRIHHEAHIPRYTVHLQENTLSGSSCIDVSTTSTYDD